MRIIRECNRGPIFRPDFKVKTRERASLYWFSFTIFLQGVTYYSAEISIANGRVGTSHCRRYFCKILLVMVNRLNNGHLQYILRPPCILSCSIECLVHSYWTLGITIELLDEVALPYPKEWQDFKIFWAKRHFLKNQFPILKILELLLLSLF